MIYYNFSLIYCYSCLIYYVLNVLFITKKHKIFDSIQYLFITIHNIFICNHLLHCHYCHLLQTS